MAGKQQMIINYVPGEECRVAIVEDGKLEELHSEKSASASRVGNIYVGRVNNVEASIQAAFVDFGVEDNGFLHISDLHPRYFPGETDDTTEQVGHKTPRRERPPIQQCLRKGDEVIVQVLKEGVGTKGPTLTSYLSIPGRFLVMMPQMDKVGVSRKVEDEELRRKMREILDQLDLPEGFGFILRTAGMDRGKAELKRDLAYLQRLWKDMERRRKGGNKPRLLYSESDLLVRSLRDLMSSDTDEVIIDNEQALVRAERFMKIVAPRTKTKLMHYPGKTPIFHAFSIERQIALINAREVPLASGGRLVIDQTEALVAIDVNSGKSRDARDSEDNAYKTNIEAVDEICRQLRLRDLGGIIVNDLIDMRSASHRKDIENRFKERLKRDRAKSTVATISPFGILEMTRQRMRGSHEQIHFSECPTCRGRGLVQKPDSVASEALRDLGALLGYDRISKVEMVVSPRVAGELLSNKRRLLGRIERESGKHVDVRVSEDIPPDRISFYAYDATGADIDLERLPAPKKPSDLKVWEFDPPADEADAWASDAREEHQQAMDAEAAAENASDAQFNDAEPHPIEIDDPADGSVADDPGAEGEGGGDGNGRRRRRRRRRGRGKGAGPSDAVGTPAPEGEPNTEPTPEAPVPSDPSAPAGTEPTQPGEGRRRRRRRRRGRGRGSPTGEAGTIPQADQAGPRERPHAPKPVPADEVTPFTIVGSMGDYGDEDAGTPAEAAQRPQDAEHDEPDADDEGEAPTGGESNTQPGAEGGSGDGRRRRRRRRRGRGGRGGEQGEQGQPPTAPRGNAEQGAPRPPQQRPPREDKRDDRREPRREGGDRSRSGRREPLPEPKPDSRAPAPAEPGVKPVRPLYFNRRKLTPIELNKRPKPE